MGKGGNHPVTWGEKNSRAITLQMKVNYRKRETSRENRRLTIRSNKTLSVAEFQEGERSKIKDQGGLNLFYKGLVVVLYHLLQGHYLCSQFLNLKGCS